MKPALILQHGPTGGPGLLAEWAQEREIPVEIHHSDSDAPAPEINGRAFVACLGSRNNPNEREVPAVAQTLALIAEAVDQEVPVLGLCYGGQVLAAVTGGSVEHSPEPQHGWHRIVSSEPALIPEGPWLEWHYDRFTPPPEATELAHTGTTVQAFSIGHHLGVQFHPESTIEIVENWARADQARLTELGIGDGIELLEAGRDNADAAREAAFQLFDAFWQRAQRQTIERRES